MYKYRITKYNPLFRNSAGEYLEEDWTAISDIGKIFNGTQLTQKVYKCVENNYVDAINIIMDFLGITYLTANDINKSFSSTDDFLNSIKKYGTLYCAQMIDVFENVTDNQTLDDEKLDSFLRLLIREDIGADVSYPRKMQVFIGYDFLMGVHTSKSIEPVISNINDLGLFVEIIE